MGALVLVASCKQPGPPGGFGVNVTVDASQVDGAARASFASATLTVTGDQPNPYVVMIDAVSVLRAGTVRFRYDPSIHSGTLAFHVDALDAGKAILASGDSGPVAIADGQTASATIVLAAPNGNDLGVSNPDLAGADFATPPDLFMPQKTGAPCMSNADCVSHFCADGVCCNSACNDACHACNLTGLAGTCSSVAAGAMPSTGHASCGPDTMSTCMRDGTCDGKGACRLYVGGTMCGPASCASGTNQFTAASTCDGMGHCAAGSTVTCAPYVCQSATACYTSCTGTNTGCIAGNVCNAGSCGLQANGSNCTIGSQCQSGHCADGVCCNSACSAVCQSCNQAAALGTCTPAPPNTDPHNNCPVGSGAASFCALGKCNGSGACNYATAGTVCQSAQCTAGVHTGAGTCNGAAICNIPSSTACSPYVCSASTPNCTNPCQAQTDCQPGYYCNTSSGTCLSCVAGATTSPVWVDMIRGLDDANHGAQPLQCAFKTLPYAIAHAVGAINVLNTDAGNVQVYYGGVVLTGNQSINCDPTGTGTKGQLNGNQTNPAVSLSGAASLLNCEVVEPSNAPSFTACIGTTNVTGQVSVNNCTLHDCAPSIGVGIEGNGSSGMVFNGNTIYNVSNCFNGMGNVSISHTNCNCGNDWINQCGTTLTGSNNCCSSAGGCGPPCNGCTCPAGFFNSPLSLCN